MRNRCPKDKEGGHDEEIEKQKGMAELSNCAGLSPSHLRLN